MMVTYDPSHSASDWRQLSYCLSIKMPMDHCVRVEVAKPLQNEKENLVNTWEAVATQCHGMLIPPVGKTSYGSTPACTICTVMLLKKKASTNGPQELSALFQSRPDSSFLQALRSPTQGQGQGLRAMLASNEGQAMTNKDFQVASCTTSKGETVHSWEVWQLLVEHGMRMSHCKMIPKASKVRHRFGCRRRRKLSNRPRSTESFPLGRPVVEKYLGKNSSTVCSSWP